MFAVNTDAVVVASDEVPSTLRAFCIDVRVSPTVNFEASDVKPDVMRPDSVDVPVTVKYVLDVVASDDVPLTVRFVIVVVAISDNVVVERTPAIVDDNSPVVVEYEMRLVVDPVCTSVPFQYSEEARA